MNKEHAILKIRQLLEARLTKDQWDELVASLLDKSMTIRSAAKHYGIGENTISTHLKTHRPYAHRQYKTLDHAYGRDHPQHKKGKRLHDDPST